MGDRERIAGHIAVGHLTSETVLPSGALFRAPEGAELHADAEAVVELGGDVDPRAGATSVAGAIASFGAALELVDLAALPGEPDSVVAANVFHRAVAFGAVHSSPPADLVVKLAVNGEVRAAARWPDDLGDRIAAAAELLDPVGERLRAGDRIITGSIVQVPVDIGDNVVADFGELGAVRLEVGRADPRS